MKPTNAESLEEAKAQLLQAAVLAAHSEVTLNTSYIGPYPTGLYTEISNLVFRLRACAAILAEMQNKRY